MRLIIAGSRSIYGPSGEAAVKNAIKSSGWQPTEIISGGARGVDTIGEEIAEATHTDLVIFRANWKKHGKAAGFKRNEKMVWYANLFNKSMGNPPDNLAGALIAVWDGKSTGTRSVIEIAEREELPTFIFRVDTTK